VAGVDTWHCWQSSRRTSASKVKLPPTLATLNHASDSPWFHFCQDWPCRWSCVFALLVRLRIEKGSGSLLLLLFTAFEDFVGWPQFVYLPVDFHKTTNLACILQLLWTSNQSHYITHSPRHKLDTTWRLCSQESTQSWLWCLFYDQSLSLNLFGSLRQDPHRRSKANLMSVISHAWIAKWAIMDIPEAWGSHIYPLFQVFFLFATWAKFFNLVVCGLKILPLFPFFFFFFFFFFGISAKRFMVIHALVPRVRFTMGSGRCAASGRSKNILKRGDLWWNQIWRQSPIILISAVLLVQVPYKHRGLSPARSTLSHKCYVPLRSLNFSLLEAFST